MLISVLKRINCVHLATVIALVLLMRKWISSWKKKSSLNLLVLLFFFELDWSYYITFIAKPPPRKFELGLNLWSVFLVKLFFISINLPYSLPWNTVVVSGPVLLVATWIYWISHRNQYMGQLVLHLLLLIKPWKNVASQNLFYRHYCNRC